MPSIERCTLCLIGKSRVEAIATRVEAIASRLEAIASRLELLLETREGRKV